MQFPFSNLILLLLLVSACGKPTPKDEGTLQSTTQPEQIENTLDACALLPATEVEAMVGEPVVVKNLGYIEAENWGACAYLDKDEQDDQFAVPWLEIQVTWSGGKEKAQQELKAAGDNLEGIVGVGDGAWFSTDVGQLSLLLKGDVLVEFYTVGLPNAANYMTTGNHAALKAQFEPLARSVASHL
jgi:hypothetical protein